MMLQHVAVRPRIQILGLAALALGAFAVVSAPRVSLAPAAPSTTAVVSQTQVQAPAVRASVRDTAAYVTGDMAGDTSPAAVQQAAARQTELQARGCQNGSAYVTGDMAGDASPAQVYATLCPR
jgi:hypothetical protein